jgi:hypothetical protein
VINADGKEEIKGYKNTYANTVFGTLIYLSRGEPSILPNTTLWPWGQQPALYAEYGSNQADGVNFPQFGDQ